MNKFLVYILLVSISLGCRPEQIEPNGFFATDFYTSPSKSQMFEYFFDDGELVAGGLDEYVVRIESEAETFSTNELILIKFKKDINEMPDSLIPFTYYMGIQYSGEIKKDLMVSFNHNYPYNNSAHLNYQEFLFFKERLNDLKLYKVTFDENAAAYYDSDIEYIEHPFEIIGDDIRFFTNDKNAFFAFCWNESSWSDTIQYNKGAMMQTNTYASNRAFETNSDGAYVENGNLYLNYSNITLVQTEGLVDGVDKFYSLNSVVRNPKEGIINHEDIYFDLTLEEVTDDNNKDKSYLKVTNNTTITLVEWPEYGERGIFKVTGAMRSEITQSNVSVDFTINFLRQR